MALSIKSGDAATNSKFHDNEISLVGHRNLLLSKGTHGVEHNGINVVLEKGLNMQITMEQSSFESLHKGMWFW